MAESLCDGLLTRDLSFDEWKLFVGDDFDYSEDYEGCSLNAMRDGRTAAGQGKG